MTMFTSTWYPYFVSNTASTTTPIYWNTYNYYTTPTYYTIPTYGPVYWSYTLDSTTELSATWDSTTELSAKEIKNCEDISSNLSIKEQIKQKMVDISKLKQLELSNQKPICEVRFDCHQNNYDQAMLLLKDGTV